MFKKILFYGDFSEISIRAFEYAVNLARTYHAKLLILHVMTDLINREAVRGQLFVYLSPNQVLALEESQKQEITDKIGIHYLQKLNEFSDYEILLRRGVDFREILSVAEKESVDIIVMGTRGRKSITDKVLGSTAEIVIKSSLRPVLFVSSLRKNH